MADKTEKKMKPFEGYVCVALLTGIIIVMGIEVVARYVFANSFPWTNELVRYLFIWFVFVGAGYAVTVDSNVRIDALHNFLPNKLKPYFEIIGMFIWTAFCIFIAYIGFQYANDLFTPVGNRSSGLNLPVAVVYVAIPIGYSLMAIRVLQQLYRIRQKSKK